MLLVAGRETVSRRENDWAGRHAAFENVLIDAETGQSEPLVLPAGTRVLDWSRNGKTFLVQEYDREAKKNRLGLAARGNQEITPLCDLRGHARYYQHEARLSPDDKQVLFIEVPGSRERKATPPKPPSLPA